MGAASAITAAVGLAVVYAVLAWGIDRRAGAYGVIVLATTPLWYATKPDVPIAQAAYALAPWSPLVPFALVRRPRTRLHLVACGSALAALAIAPAHAPPFVAVAIGAMLRDLDDRDDTSTLLAAAVFALGALVVRDVGLAPERMLVAFGLHLERATSGTLPAVAAAARMLRWAMWIVLVGALASLLVPRSVLRIPRGALLAAAGAGAGILVAVEAWPVVMLGVTPDRVLDEYRARRRRGEPLAAIGVDAGERSFADPALAARWLDEAPAGERRFLALAKDELARVNAAFRKAHQTNVPVVAGARGAYLLATNALAAGERSENPLDGVVLAAPPDGVRGSAASLGGLELVGWQLAGEGGRERRVRVVLRVLADAPLRGHCTFLHVDHVPARFSAEHVEHAYPSSLWRAGDVVVDEFAFTLPPHFGRGSYAMWWGAGVLPCEDDRRMRVLSGEHDAHDRIPLGRLEVR